ncbi:MULTISPECIES: DDE-type integrase/transposase/recombinase [Staphylococcus]
MKIKGKWRYLYGGIDREGDRLDIWLGKEGDND